MKCRSTHSCLWRPGDEKYCCRIECRGRTRNVVEAAYFMKGVNVIKVINVLRLVNIFKAFNIDNFVAFLRCIAPSRAVSAPQCESQIDRAMTGTKPTDAPLMDT